MQPEAHVAWHLGSVDWVTVRGAWDPRCYAPLHLLPLWPYHFSIFFPTSRVNTIRDHSDTTAYTFVGISLCQQLKFQTYITSY